MPVVCLLLAGCASQVGGTAQPVASPTSSANSGVAAGEPCALLKPEELEHLGLAGPGEFKAGEPNRLVPPSCYWRSAEAVDSLTAYFGTGFSLAEYVAGADPAESEQIGGIEWARYPSEIGGEGLCMLATELSETSFVVLSSANYSEQERACAKADAAAPFVSGRLPGGEQTSVPPPPPEPERSALAETDPCTLLKPAEAKQLGRKGTPVPLEAMPDLDIPHGCQWEDTDGERGQKALDLFAGDVPVEKWPKIESGEKVKAGEYTWAVVRDEYGVCDAAMSFTENASVKITSGNLDRPKKGCDAVRAAIPLITANLPEP